MAVHVFEKYIDSPEVFNIGPASPISASPWRILSVFISGTGTVALTMSNEKFTILEGTFTDEMILPSATIPFPVTVGNSVVTCSVTAPTDFGIRIVWENGIG